MIIRIVIKPKQHDESEFIHYFSSWVFITEIINTILSLLQTM